MNESDELAIQIESDDFNDELNEDYIDNGSGSSIKKQSKDSKYESEKLLPQEPVAETKEKLEKHVAKSLENSANEANLPYSIASQIRIDSKNLGEQITATPATSPVPATSSISENVLTNTSKSKVIKLKSSTSSQAQSSSSSQPTLKRTPILSQVGAVISKERKNLDNERYSDRIKKRSHSNSSFEEEESSPRGKASGQLASIIKVSERKFKLPASLQPNKSILLKAVDEANSSVKSTGSKPRSIADEKLEQIRANRSSEISSLSTVSTKVSGDRIELFSEHYRMRHESNLEDRKTLEDDRSRSGSKKRLKIHSVPTPIELARNDNETFGDKRKPVIDEVFGDRRHVQIDDYSDSPIALKTIDTNNKEMIESSMKPNLASTNEPKFIVTLSGVKDDKYNKIFKTNNNYSNNKSDLDSYEEINENNFNDYEMNNETAMTADNENNLDENMEDESGADANLSEQNAKRKLIRCTFWPFCDKGDHCAFLHPNKPCTAFPNCTYGNQCHYLHPSCRYDGYCTRLDCPYTHMIKKSTAPPTSSASGDFLKNGTSSMTSTTSNLSTTTSSGPNKVPKITINKIQPLYSLVKPPITTPANISTSQVTANKSTDSNEILPDQSNIVNTSKSNLTMLHPGMLNFRIIK
jgi:hypothetical protein